MPTISFGTLECMMKLIGPRAWSSLSRVSRPIRPPSLTRRIRTWKERPLIPSPSTASSLSQLPSGIRDSRVLRMVSRHCSSKSAQVASTVSAPKRSNSSSTRRSPRRQPASTARMSPCRMSGKRELRRKMRNASSFRTPSR
jgi:hypothetical protein